MMLGTVLFLSGTGFGFIIGLAVAVRVGKPSRTAPVEPVEQDGDSRDFVLLDLLSKWSSQ